MLATGPTMITTLGLAGGVAVAAPTDGTPRPTSRTRPIEAARTSFRMNPPRTARTSGGMTRDEYARRVSRPVGSAQSRDGHGGHGPIGATRLRKMEERWGRVAPGTLGPSHVAVRGRTGETGGPRLRVQTPASSAAS